MFEQKPDSLKHLNDELRQNPTWEKLANVVTAETRRLLDEPRWKLQRLRSHNVVQRGDFFDTPYGRGRVSFIRRKYEDADGKRLKNDQFIDEVEVSLDNGLSTRIQLRTMPERPVAQNNVAMLGFDYFSDSLDDADYQSMMRYVADYWPYSGDGNFVNFISFIKRIRFDIFQLHTPDYGDPTKRPVTDPYLYLERFNPLVEQLTYQRPGFSWNKATPTNGFGGVYPTSHVELEHDAIRFPTVDYKDVTRLFYFMAPIHLVLERFVKAVHSNLNNYQGSVASIDMYDTTSYIWSPDAELTPTWGIVGSMDCMDHSYLCLDEDFNSLAPLEA